MKKKILVRYGDLMLKKKNIKFFIKKIRDHIVNNLHDLECSIEFSHDRALIGYPEQNEEQVIDQLKKIPGIFNFSIAYLSEPTLKDIIEQSILVLNQEIKTDGVRFKIETKRIDKQFPMTSLEITQKVASPILEAISHKVIVDVKHPEKTLYIDLRSEAAYIYIGAIKGMGGFPYGSAGKGLLMMSGGIDSPVAAYLTIKQGLDLEFIHFESTPLTPLESVQKVIDLTKKIAHYVPDQKIKLHLVPFYEIHHNIIETVFEPYMITVMRRMMYRISERFAKMNKMLVLVNGESICQVASQTLQSMKVIESVTSYPIIRPVATYDKLEIIQLSEKIDTYTISIRPYNDCCSIYVPKSPVTRPIEPLARKYENKFDYEPMLERALSHIQTLWIDTKYDQKITDHGFTVDEAISKLI
jgi:tRNA uracil 4-sulfurtransferase